MLIDFYVIFCSGKVLVEIRVKCPLRNNGSIACINRNGIGHTHSQLIATTSLPSSPLSFIFPMDFTSSA